MYFTYHCFPVMMLLKQSNFRLFWNLSIVGSLHQERVEFMDTKREKNTKKELGHSKKMSRSYILRTLFRSMFVLSACTFGGGFVIVSLMKKKYVEQLRWLDEDEMLDITAITQSSPGPLPVNASVIIGYRMCGIFGSLVAVLGAILPPMIIISIISLFYEQFRTNRIIALGLQVMRAGVAAVIFDVVINLAKNVCKTKRVLYIGMMLIAFFCTFFLKINAMLIILTCLMIGILDLLLSVNKEKRRA